MSPDPVDEPNRSATSFPLRWIVVRLAPLLVVGVLFAISLAGMDLAQDDRHDFAAVGFGLLVLAGVLWLMRLRFRGQETLAGASRLATIVAITVVLGLVVAGGAR